MQTVRKCSLLCVSRWLPGIYGRMYSPHLSCRNMSACCRMRRFRLCCNRASSTLICPDCRIQDIYFLRCCLRLSEDAKCSRLCRCRNMNSMYRRSRVMKTLLAENEPPAYPLKSSFKLIVVIRCRAIAGSLFFRLTICVLF